MIYPKISPWEPEPRECRGKNKNWHDSANISTKSYIKKVTNDSDRDYWMKASEAKSYGMVDEVLKKSS